MASNSQNDESEILNEIINQISYHTPTTGDRYKDTVAIGRENAEMIRLGKAWCTHIRTDRSQFGVGLVEEASGLPIWGGKFTCDFTRKPVGFAAMRLADSSVAFFKYNCLGCGDRSPGGRVPNLRTWAEQRMAERERHEQVAADADRVAGSERQQRISQRTFAGGLFSAAAQEVVELVNRLDVDRLDKDTARQIRSLAALAPEAFEEVKDLLYIEVGQLRSPVLLEVLVRLDRDSGSPDLHSLCVSAVADAWARSVGCEYLAQQGIPEDVTEGLINGVIFQSAPSGTAPSKSGGEPAALLHYYSLRPDVVESRITGLLGHGNPARRAAAAHAARHVAAVDGDAGPRLLPALLETLKFPEDRRSVNNPTGRAVETVALFIRSVPAEVEAAVNARWMKASPEYRVRMLRCFDAAVPYGSGQLSDEVAHSVLSRAVSVLSQPREAVEDALNQDYQRHAADMLKRTIPLSAAASPSTQTLLYLLVSWLEHSRVLAESEFEGPFAFLEKLSEQAQIDYIVRAIAESVVAAGHRDPGDFLTACEEIYGQAQTPTSVRAKIVHVAGRVGAGSSEHCGDVLPLIYTAIFAQEHTVRAAGLEATEAVLGAIPSESTPPLLAEAIIPGLSDQYLMVVRAAIDAIRWVPTDLIDHQHVSKTLLGIARAHAPILLYERVSLHAIEAALNLTRHDPQLLTVTQTTSLEAIASMPADRTRRALSRYGALRQAQGWTDVAIGALRAGADQRFERLGDRYKEELLHALGRRHLSESQIESLELTEMSVGRSDHKRLLLSADVFAELGRPDISSRLIRAFLDDIPDTIEMRSRRRSVLLTLLRFDLEVAVECGDGARQQSIGAEVEAICSDDGASASETDSLAAIRARIAIVEALSATKEGTRNVEPLAGAVAAYQDAYEPIENDIVWVFSELAKSLVYGVRWTDGLWNAEAEAERHAVAARMRAETVAPHIQEGWPLDLTESCQVLAHLADPKAIPIAAAKLCRVPQPPRITNSFKTPQAARSLFESEQRPVSHSVALLIRLDGEPAMRPTILRPGAMHQFRVEARVNGWPSGADILEVTFLTVHPRDYLYASDVTFTADALDQPLEIRVDGERPPNAPSLSLTARAAFRRGSERLDTHLVGNTTLEVTTFDPGTATPLNMPHTAKRLQHMMMELQNRLPHLDERDHRDIRLLLEAVLRYGHTVLDDRLPELRDVDEKWFQRELKYFFSADQAIGARLLRGVGRAGGTTDLELGNIVVELKVEKNTPVSLERAKHRFVGQATQYASAGDSPVSLLVVLDASPKRAPAGVMGNDIGWVRPETVSGSGHIPSMVGIAIIRTGFPRPSDLSQ